MKIARISQTSALVIAAVLGSVAFPAVAQEAGDIQVKLLGTAVLPDGKITDVRTDLVGLPAGTQTEANDNVVPTLAIEYFVSPNISIETICCATQHDVDAIAGAPGAELVSDAVVIPATFTLKYHFNPGGVSPYVGAGPTYFLWIDDEPGAAAVALGADNFSLSDELGFALQAGIDIPFGENGFGASIDVKRYFVDSTARWFANGVTVIETEHAIDPWVVSAGVTYRF